ncbi:MAG: VTT domain-containing protein [Oscillospiraceae bacterium]|jgi:uncharacterized membrane protein YdjX (TVP38/TMEM64 family)|nr:VTT domain-containing protein [Oscillospiraceae bacterium]
MKRIYSIISIIAFAAVAIAGTVILWRSLSQFDGDYPLFKEYINSYGVLGYLIFIAIQILQIFFALIPGEFIELAAGYIFGKIVGFLLCMLGIAIASSAIFLLVRTLGKKVFVVFSDSKMYEKLKFLQNEKKLNLIVFILFFIPGTPKDLLTYFLGMTKMKYLHFITITLIARIPSVITSTIVGESAGEGNLIVSLSIFGVTGLLSIAGIIVYRRLIKKRQQESSS